MRKCFRRLHLLRVPKIAVNFLRKEEDSYSTSLLSMAWNPSTGEENWIQTLNILHKELAHQTSHGTTVCQGKICHCNYHVHLNNSVEAPNQQWGLAPSLLPRPALGTSDGSAVCRCGGCSIIVTPAGLRNILITQFWSASATEHTEHESKNQQWAQMQF